MKKKTKTKTKYTKPVITAVKLDPRQAVLAVCKTNNGFGAWIQSTLAMCVAGTNTGPYQCPTSPRGSFGIPTNDNDVDPGS